MKRIKVAISLIFIGGVVAALAGETFGYPPLLVKARKFGAKDCTFCHVDPEGGPPWNDRGKWLIAEKERRGADTVDVEWLADYKPGKVADQKPAEAAKTDDKKPSTSSAQPGKADPKTFDDYAGEYEVPNVGTLIVTHEGDKLFGEPRDGGTKEELQPQEDGTFLVTNVNAKVKFVRDDKGKVVELEVNLNGQELKGKKIK
ncbi:MAG TPA: DUF3471 domain-containing protein [Blastocatellia bacterium]|nr:DUF3471 domain-containing protein [Blastocatellia bacterium]